MDNGFWTFTGQAFSFDEAVQEAEKRVREWLKTHQYRGAHNEPLYTFQHGHMLVSKTPGVPIYRYVISAFGPANEGE